MGKHIAGNMGQSNVWRLANKKQTQAMYELMAFWIDLEGKMLNYQLALMEALIYLKLRV